MERNSGILLHPTSLPDSPICGTFGSPARAWLNGLAENGIGVWQFLPLAPPDPLGSPYSSPSSFAFNPWFLDENDLVRDGFLAGNIKKFASEFEGFEKRVDFQLANSKVKVLSSSLIDNWEKQDTTIKEEFEFWCKKQFWLDDHSIFMELRIQNNNLPWWEWPENFAVYDKHELAEWKIDYQKELLGHNLIQWHLDRQWKSIRKLANKLGIFLFGDVPFYVSKDSADVWSNRSLFSILTTSETYLQSGVPPDYFSETGQLWGNPVYRWSRHKANKYRWWRKRISRHLDQVDFLRLDHFRALEAFWAIPGKDKTAENGFWLPSPGKEILGLIKKDCGGSLPLVAEDLGLITSKVEKLRDDYELAGMKILQFAFDGNLNNPYLPENIKDENWIVYTGTHDNSTSLGWWKEIDQDKKEQIKNIIRDSDNFSSWDLISVGMNTRAKLFVAPMQDLLNLDDCSRLNKPGTIEGNWSWRLNKYDLNIKEALYKYGNLAKRYKR
ncbi:4-alpha-glucanotransferase [Prochlorococcus marinus]|uniref:4-alpha-glucanotransferase n=1 Tax=Prochlorococcus marinus XMU1408 TaxID=2213228 RepID=A0A318R3R7_PROMR|nr:4-alpha-glucanotransferase [Prochlorococcus marinus]MBW3042276.1 4-alpha-glucanotransferase [Prochlorococcus marinus str. XMU1408]PYE01664.1 4-alpha-glucanotransferase [Prochlorococcus marinus XMU1408]